MTCIIIRAGNSLPTGSPRALCLKRSARGWQRVVGGCGKWGTGNGTGNGNGSGSGSGNGGQGEKDRVGRIDFF
jgi:hypothetical protein